MQLNGHGQRRAVESRIWTYSRSSVSETEIIQERGLHGRDLCRTFSGFFNVYFLMEKTRTLDFVILPLASELGNYTYC